jgi:acyl-ACP thioesterase
MECSFVKQFDLRYFEMNKHGTASPTAILTLLEETAADHCYSIGHSLYSLEKQNIGWVLMTGSINMYRYPRYKEIIRIKTWLSKFTLVKGYRENVITDGTDQIIGKAKEIWAFYDIQNRKPIPIFEDIRNKWSINQQISTEIDTNLINPVITDSPEIEFDVYRSDVDSNKHVNNIRYFHWLIESLPSEVLDEYILEKISAKFYSEAKFGEKVQVYINNNLEDKTFIHTMKSNNDNKLLVVAHTKWQKNVV